MTFMAKPKVAHPGLPHNALGLTRRDYEGSISTLCAGCGLFGLFLFFVDRRSRAVRRFAAQSAGLLCVVAFLSAGMAILAALLGFVPFVGGALSAIVWILLAATLCGDIYLRVRMAAHAYRGEAYVLPLIGERCRQFE